MMDTQCVLAATDSMYSERKKYAWNGAKCTIQRECKVGIHGSEVCLEWDHMLIMSGGLSKLGSE